MKKKSYISTKFIILIPVFILGFVSVVSNILAVTNIRRVNANATQIANGYMNCISELGDIQKETLLIHRLGLSHIVATDLNTMISLVETIRSEQETLETYLDDFQEYVTDDNKAEYDELVSNYEGMKYELANLMAYSANNDNEAAYALANGKIADYSSAMQESIAAIRTNVSENADVAKEQLAAVYRTAIAASTASIIISVAALLATLICVFRLVIIPLLKTQKEITDIIEDEFGCEGRPEGEEPMVTILLVDDTGKQRSIRMADKLAYEKKLDIGVEMELPEEEIMTLNGKEYKVKKLLGKGKGGYSYLVTDGEKEYVLKQIHHEPCSYYQIDNKLEAEKRDYKRLMEIGMTMPKLLDIDETQERILKEYIPGDTVYQQVEKDALPEICLQQVKEM